MFYSKLLPFLDPDYRNFKDIYDQMTIGKVAMEKAFNYRMHMLFMSPEGQMSREGIKDALDQREENIKKVEREAAELHARQADTQAAMVNPQVIAAMLANPQVRAAFAAVLNNEAGDVDV